MNIFVFGSNLAGRHGKGAALYAKLHYGARYGCGVGHIGNSYAIPTKDFKLRTLDLNTIEIFIGDFVKYAKNHPEYTFLLTPIGCGLAGYRRDQIRPLFEQFELPTNIVFTKEWEDPDVN